MRTKEHPMIRSATLCCLLVLSASPALAAPSEPKTPPLATKLKQPVKFNGIEDPKTTVAEALDLLASHYDLQFDVNEEAFKEDGTADVLTGLVAERPIPKMTNVSLETVLRKVLSHVPAQSGTTYILRRNVVEVTTQASVIREIWGDAYKGPFLPLVTLTFDKVPLEDALKDLAAAADHNVVLDGRVADKAQLPVSARFENTPLDTAVRLLADMADLKPFPVDNVLYVTSRERADQLEAKEKQQQMAEDPNAPTGPRVGQGRRFVRPNGAGM
jgi:hypothetical protein